MKLGKVSRIVQILTILQAGHYHSVDDLVKILGMNRRTVFRDLKELKAIGVPCRFDTKRGGYHIDPEFFLPPIDLNLPEALSLLLLVHQARNHLPIPFKNSALLAGLKIENNLPAKIRHYCHTSLQNISIRPYAHAPMDLLDKIFAKIQQAMRNKRKARMAYHSLYDKKNITTTLKPYHLMYNHRAWYVIGESSLHKSIRTFKLNRIKKLEILESRFIDGEKFDIYEYIGRAWSMIPEGKIYRVKLRFTPKVARNVAEVQWHSTQKTTLNEDGSLLAEFRVDGLGEISWWILGYGDQVEVLAPAALRRRIAKTAQRMVELNSKNI
ncbi:MAG: helix-turn-helix transcriptional regulator [Planctomycetota bacterium]